MTSLYSKSVLILLLSAAVCVACAPNAVLPVASLYDYQLSDSSGKNINIDAFLKQVADADVIMVGEWHGHPGVHLFQARLLAALATEPAELALSMEHFTRADQAVLNQYLGGEIGEAGLVDKAEVWDNYKSDYRPLVELARLNQIPVIAANAPRAIVKCVGLEGPSYLSRLSKEQRQLAAKTLDLRDSPYKQRFLKNMQGMTLSEKRIEKMFGSQLTWDATMAESMVLYKAQHPNVRIMHVAGLFHVIGGLGTGAEILKLMPDLKIVYISASSEEPPSVGEMDYRLQIQSLPPLYLTEAERKSVFAKHKPTALDCS